MSSKPVQPSDRALRTRITKPVSAPAPSAVQVTTAAKKRPSKADRDAQKDANEARMPSTIQRLATVEHEEQQRQRQASQLKPMPKKVPRPAAKQDTSAQASTKTSSQTSKPKSTSTKGLTNPASSKKSAQDAQPATKTVMLRREKSSTRKDIDGARQQLDGNVITAPRHQQDTMNGKVPVNANDVPQPGTQVQFLKRVASWTNGVAQEGRKTSSSTSASGSMAGRRTVSTAPSTVRSKVSSTKSRAPINIVQNEQDDDTPGAGIHTEDDAITVARERSAITSETRQAIIMVNTTDDTTLPLPISPPTVSRQLKRKAAALDLDEGSSTEFELPSADSDLDPNYTEAQVLPSFSDPPTPIYYAEGGEDGGVEEPMDQDQDQYTSGEDRDDGAEDELMAEGEEAGSQMENDDGEENGEGEENNDGEDEEASTHRTTKDMNAQVSAPVQRATKRPRVTPCDSTGEGSGNLGGKRRVWVLSDLPPGACDNGRWGNEFLPTIVHYFGDSDTVWNNSDSDIMDAIKKAWHAVYGKPLPQNETLTGAVFGLTKKKLVEWRSAFGSTAIAALIASLAQHAKFTYEDQKEFAEGQIWEDQFLNSGKNSAGRPAGMLLGEFFQIVLASHQLAIQGRVHVPEFVLKRKDSQDQAIYAPIAACVLAAATCSRALILVRNASFGDIDKALGRVNVVVPPTLSSVNKAKKSFDAVKKQEKARTKKEREERGKAKEQDAEKDRAIEEDEEDEVDEEEEELDDEGSILPFSKDHNEDATFNYAYLINRCPNERLAEALAMSSKYIVVPRRLKNSSVSQAKQHFEPKLDERAFREINRKSPSLLSILCLILWFQYKLLPPRLVQLSLSSSMPGT
ncbi:hypothetical protein CONPUDRAFT_154474 [Coniophora puteana RWD-64-598 SS2]|uniref:Uncharacterized protein n=1 Tax=Coniophora puteana (strain RWD-64-598) TaxID=741705 RepID=A0A5M3MNS9_CONPW|nr:uncharacterized protein CONPUDRAFT_154474 [Coniophora puteana RWD-64-598 SS2]EIW80444.1 hypothetical protein CONPUDRAFT_154474 [Coniophora puteana RWD-64-598 SS2]